MKRNRQNEKRNARNNSYRTRIKSVTKKVLADVSSKDAGQAQEDLKTASKTIEKIAGKGALHKRAASRKISQLAKKVHQLASAG